MSQIADLLAAPLPDYHFHELRLDITVNRIDFTAPAGTHLLYAKERFEDPGLLKLCFEYFKGWEAPEPADKPYLYLVAGHGFVPPTHYEIVKSVEMMDGLKWNIYFSTKG